MRQEQAQDGSKDRELSKRYSFPRSIFDKRDTPNSRGSRDSSDVFEVDSSVTHSKWATRRSSGADADGGPLGLGLKHILPVIEHRVAPEVSSARDPLLSDKPSSESVQRRFSAGERMDDPIKRRASSSGGAEQTLHDPEHPLRGTIKEMAMSIISLVRRMFKQRELLASISTHKIPIVYADLQLLNIEVSLFRRHLRAPWGQAVEPPRTDPFVAQRANMLSKTEMMTLNGQVTELLSDLQMPAPEAHPLGGAGPAAGPAVTQADLEAALNECRAAVERICTQFDFAVGLTPTEALKTLGNLRARFAAAIMTQLGLPAGARIHEFTHIDGEAVGVTVGAGALIGPFARLRPGAELGPEVHIGNFVEVKNSTLGAGAKANHLAYLGDTTVGERVNFGAGSITANYDGANKHRTEIGDDVHVGSNCVLVAPITLGAGSTIGGGSTVTRDAPAGQLTVTRARQMSLANWKRPVKSR